MQRADLRVLHSFYGDAELMRFVTGKPRTPWETRARLRKDLRHHEQHGFGLCIAEWRQTGQPVGRCGLEPTEGPDGLQGELAWMFSKPWWGKGLATEAGAALLRFGIEELGLPRVFAAADPLNVASVQVMKKLGMRLADETETDIIYEVCR